MPFSFGFALYLEDGRVRISNADVERAIKPFCRWPKNWLFHQTERGAEAGANLYSIIETCKANNINAYEYLRYVFIQAKVYKDDPEKLKQMRPYNIDLELLKVA